MSWEWCVAVSETALHAWCYVTLFDVLALVTTNYMERRGYRDERIHAIVDVPFALLFVAASWCPDTPAYARADPPVNDDDDMSHITWACVLVWTVSRVCDDMCQWRFVAYRRARMFYDAARRLRYPNVDVWPAEWAHALLAHAVAILYSVLPTPRGPTRHITLVLGVASLVTFERALRCMVQDLSQQLERTLSHRWMRNYTLYRNYNLFVNPQMCRGRWSPFWDTLQGRNPFPSRLPVIGACPLPFVDFFVVDYAPEETLIEHARLRHCSLTEHMAPPLYAQTGLWTQALWRAFHRPPLVFSEVNDLPQRPESPPPVLVNALSPSTCWRRLCSHVRRRLRGPRAQTVRDASAFCVLPIDVAAYIYAHLDYLDHIHLRACSHSMRRVSQVPAASCRRMQIDFGACDHSAGLLPFVRRVHVRPRHLHIKNVGGYISSLAFLAAENLPVSLRALRLDRVARGRYSFGWLPRLTRLRALRIRYAGERQRDFSGWLPVATSTKLALRHLDCGSEHIAPDMWAPSVLTRTLVHLTASCAAMRMATATVLTDFGHFACLTSLTMDALDESESLSALCAFPVLSRLQLQRYTLDVQNIRHLGNVLAGTMLQHLILTGARGCLQPKPRAHLFECVAKNAPQLRTLAVATSTGESRCCFTHKLALLRSCRFLERLEIDERSSPTSYQRGRTKKRLLKSLGEGLSPSLRVLALTSRHVWAYGDAGLSCFAAVNTALREIHLFCRPHSDDRAKLDEERAHILFRNLTGVALHTPIRTATTVATIEDRHSFQYVGS